jgi:hypothetical protein
MELRLSLFPSLLVSNNDGSSVYFEYDPQIGNYLETELQLPKHTKLEAFSLTETKFIGLAALKEEDEEDEKVFYFIHDLKTGKNTKLDFGGLHLIPSSRPEGIRTNTLYGVTPEKEEDEPAQLILVTLNSENPKKFKIHEELSIVHNINYDEEIWVNKFSDNWLMLSNRTEWIHLYYRKKTNLNYELVPEFETNTTDKFCKFEYHNSDVAIIGQTDGDNLSLVFLKTNGEIEEKKIITVTKLMKGKSFEPDAFIFFCLGTNTCGFQLWLQSKILIITLDNKGQIRKTQILETSGGATPLPFDDDRFLITTGGTFMIYRRENRNKDYKVELEIKVWKYQTGFQINSLLPLSRGRKKLVKMIRIIPIPLVLIEEVAEFF